MTLNQISGVITTVMVNVFVHGIPLDIGILKDRVTVMNNYFSAEGDVSNFVLLRIERRGSQQRSVDAAGF